MSKDSYKIDAEHNQLDIDYHNTIADEYETVVNEPRRLSNDILFNALFKQINIKIGKFLDLGCGTGQMIERVGSRFQPEETWAVDHSSGMLAYSQQCADKLKLKNFTAVQSDLLAFLENCQDKFSLISAVGVIHHLKPDHVPDLLSKCHQLLAENGLLVLAEPVDVKALYQTPQLIKKWNEKSAFIGRHYSQHAEEPDEHPLKEGWMEQQLTQAGFKVTKTNRGIELFPHNKPPSAFDKLAIKMMQKIYGRKGFVVAWLVEKA